VIGQFHDSGAGFDLDRVFRRQVLEGDEFGKAPLEKKSGEKK